MKLTVLMENEALRPEFCCAFGLSLYVETGAHRILFDAGPDGSFVQNARTLGVDLRAVTEAVLSHGHYDHGDGLAAFLEENDSAPVYARTPLFPPCFSQREDGPHYIGVAPNLQAHRARFVPVEGDRELDEGLWLFRSTGNFPTLPSRLKVKSGAELVPDPFSHEHSLLITQGERAVVLAGCSHRGIVNIVRRAEERLGRAPDAVVGGFHLMDADSEDPAARALLDRTGAELARGNTVYYTGHCTGDYAFRRLAPLLGDRLHRIRAGSVLEL